MEKDIIIVHIFKIQLKVVVRMTRFDDILSRFLIGGESFFKVMLLER
jgi:hypothetical protein